MRIIRTCSKGALPYPSNPTRESRREGLKALAKQESKRRSRQISRQMYASTRRNDALKQRQRHRRAARESQACLRPLAGDRPRGGRGHARKQRGPAPAGAGTGPPPRENAPCWSAAPCSPTAFRRSTIGARGLNFRVRNGTGCASPAMAADQQGAFCCHGRAPVPSGPHSARTPNAPGSRARPRDPGVEEEELGLLVALG